MLVTPDKSLLTADRRECSDLTVDAFKYSDSIALYLDASTGTSDTMPQNMAVFKAFFVQYANVNRGQSSRRKK